MAIYAHRSGWSTTFVTRKPSLNYLPVSVVTTEFKEEDIPPVCRIGLIADVQAAAKDDVKKEGGRTMYFRSAFEKLARTIDTFLKEENLTCVIQLGDCIDGNENEKKTHEDFERVASQFDRLHRNKIPCYSVLGNHCLSLPREVILSRLKMSASYYQAKLTHDWKLLVCDSNDLALVWPQGHHKRIEAETFLHRVQRECTESSNHSQLQSYNGGFTSAQLEWLESQLKAARLESTNIIIAAHHPLSASAARRSHCAWNLYQIQSLLFKYNDVIRLVLAGHDHLGGYFCHHGIHFLTLEALLETPTDAFAILDITPHGLGLRGFGSVTSQFLPYSTLLNQNGGLHDDDIDHNHSDFCSSGGLDDDDPDDHSYSEDKQNFCGGLDDDE